MKKLILAATAAAMSISVSAASDDVSVYLNGRCMDFDTAPEIVNDTTFVPLRTIVEALGSEVDWDGETQTVTISKNDIVNTLVIGSCTVETLTAGKAAKMILDASPYIKDERTMVPLRYISEAFGMNVDWEETTRSVIITSPLWAWNSSGHKYYPDTQIPDFGNIYTYMPSEQSDEQCLYYNNVKETDKTDYRKLLSELGFTQVDEMNNIQTESYAYIKDDELITMSTFHLPEMDGVFAILYLKNSDLKVNPEKIQYYKEYPHVPDLGKLCGLPLHDSYQDADADNIRYYVYSSADKSADELASLLMIYTNALSYSGFEMITNSTGIAMYSNQESENTVIIQIVSHGIIVMAEQWPTTERK